MNSFAYMDFISTNLCSKRKNSAYEKLEFIRTMTYGYKEPIQDGVKLNLRSSHNVKQYYDTIRNNHMRRLVCVRVGNINLQLQQSPYGEYIKTLIIAVDDKYLFAGDINSSGIGRFSRAVDLGISTTKLDEEETECLLKLLTMLVNVGLLQHTDGKGKFFYTLGIGNKQHVESFRIGELEETAV